MSPEQKAHRGHLLAYGTMIESCDFKNDAGLAYVIEGGKLVVLFPPVSPPEGKLPHLKFTNKALLDNKLSKLPRKVVQRICPKRGVNLDIVTLLYEDQTDAYGAYLLYSGVPTLEDFITGAGDQEPS